MVGTVDTQGRTASTVYNADGQVVSSTDKNGNTTTNTYNADGAFFASYRGKLFALGASGTHLCDRFC